jgi:polyisoprenoid-binding protein YceI
MSTTETEAAVRQVDGRTVPAAGRYTIDQAHSTVEFVARHLMITKVRGRFTGFSGEIEIAEAPEQSSASVTIDAATVDTGDGTRDGHLRGADFFNVEEYPSLTFRSTSVEPGKGDSWKLHGELTVGSVTKPVTLDVEFEGAGPSPWGDTRIGFSASTEVDREHWGLTWNQALEAGGVLVGKKIRIELDVQAILQP